MDGYDLSQMFLLIVGDKHVFTFGEGTLDCLSGCWWQLLYTERCHTY